MYALVHVDVFLYEDSMEPRWMFIIHYDPRLSHVFVNALVDTEKNNDGQQNEREGLNNNKEIDIWRRICLGTRRQQSKVR